MCLGSGRLAGWQGVKEQPCSPHRGTLVLRAVCMHLPAGSGPEAGNGHPRALPKGVNVLGSGGTGDRHEGSAVSSPWGQRGRAQVAWRGVFAVCGSSCAGRMGVGTWERVSRASGWVVALHMTPRP